MATYQSNGIEGKMQGLIDAIDTAPSISSPGKLEIYTAAYATLLVTLTLNIPCANQNDPALTFEMTPMIAGVAVANGTAAIARICTYTDEVILDGLTVDTAAADVILDSTTIATSDVIVLDSAEIIFATS